MTDYSHLSPDRWRLGVVSYLNAKPLVEGLESDPAIDMVFDVPARLPALLERGEVDAALVPVIDLLRNIHRWRIVSDACIGCDGETLTVRVFSKVPPDSIQTMYADTDSHTSISLATIIWRERFQRALDIQPLRTRKGPDDGDAILLIGDKVVNHSLIGYDIETDLGSAWKSLTGLPFVFAVWAAPHERRGELSGLAQRLNRARDAGVASAELIAADYGPGLGWPVALAKRYLTTRLGFHLGPRQREGMQKFLELAQAQAMIPPHSELVFA